MTFAFGSIEALVRFFRVIKSNRGQLSIFMGITLILVMGMLAFIVNIGLFVKAKINLQNAVDAAAFSGAATQARQLTNIAYVNWEMRNTYKEWMFKYYILGQMGLVKGNNNLSDSVLAANDRVNFLLQRAAVAGDAGFDKYNVPSICVHNNSSTDICPIYTLPGIPRFPALGVAGITEAHEALVNKLVDEKGANCSQRTQLNFLAALSWAYSSGIKEVAGAPLIATNRAGAWPEALELAMRIRNLEMIMNRPPVNEIKWDTVDNLANTSADIGLNERPIKAFMSAFRNLGGGKYKDALETGAGSAYDELPATFKLTELAPDPFKNAQTTNVSGFLIPPTFTYPGDVSVSALTKHYIDLQAIPVNYATMFSTFATTRNEYEPTVDMEASCSVSKSALPVPGYIMDFPKILKS
jgi:Flp pilus assembly protein TadG